MKFLLAILFCPNKLVCQADFDNTRQHFNPAGKCKKLGREDTRILKRQVVRFLLNDQEAKSCFPKATDSLLDWLRLDQGLCGSKEGCAEGDCGACTVLVGRINAAGELVYEAVNSCIRLMGSLNNCHVVTIEHLKNPDGSLNPVQQAMLDFHGSQCGFCTPGIVMSLYALFLSDIEINEAGISRFLQGNLCRCTGYESIFKAALSLNDSRETIQHNDHLTMQRKAVKAALLELVGTATPHDTSIQSHDDEVIIPQNLDELLEVLSRLENPVIVAGSTDAGLWVTKQMRNIAPAVFINQIAELQAIEDTEEGITIGAGVTYSEAAPVMLRHFPELKNFWFRIAGEQVRNMGTIGGNIANGSPIGDTPPALIPLNARLELRSKGHSRTIPLEEFFIEYGKQDRADNEIVASVFVPRKHTDDLYRVYKISKRFDEDISALCGGFRIRLSGDRVSDAAIAFGGMAAIPKRALAVEQALVGKPWTMETVEFAMEGFGEDFSPLSDWRASADYRLMVARNLLKRFWLETSSGDEAPVSIRQFETGARHA